MNVQGPPAFKRSALNGADGVLLKKAREAAGLSRQKLSETAQVASITIARIERGTQLPLPATLRAIADALTVDLDTLAPGWSADILESESTDPSGPRLRTARLAAAVPLEQAAEAAGVSVSTFSRFERDLHQSRRMEGRASREGMGLDSEQLAHLLGFNDAGALRDCIEAAPVDFNDALENELR